MIVSRYSGFEGITYDPEAAKTWCAQKYAGNQELIDRCSAAKGCFLGVCAGALAPWTDAGAAARGLPKPGIATIIGKPPAAKPPAAPPAEVPSADEGLFGVPTTILYVGGGVLLVGIAAFLALRPKPHEALSGYKRKSRRVRRGKARR